VDGAEGALQGNAAFSSMLPMLIGQMPELINRIGKKVRKVELTIYFPYGNGTFPMDVTQYVIDQQSAQFEVFTPGVTQ
jgi:general secretion pathway protein I